jgi:hypothetical protein
MIYEVAGERTPVVRVRRRPHRKTRHVNAGAGQMALIARFMRLEGTCK